jgi:hypothetical protein
MSIYDRTVYIKASPEIVWKKLDLSGRIGTLLREEPNRLSITECDGTAYVYLLEQQEDGFTNLRGFADKSSGVKEIISSYDIPSKLNILSSVENSTHLGGFSKWRILLKILFSLFYIPYAPEIDTFKMMDRRVKNIQHMAEDAAQKAH